MRSCESCYNMRGKLPFKYRNEQEFDFFRYVCHCRLGMLKTFDGKADRTFQVGGRFRMKVVPAYEAWRVAENCMEYQSMD